MKSYLLSLLFIISTGIGNAQGPQQLVEVPAAPGVHVRGWLYLPADYTASSRRYPVVFFYHGLGEAGNNPYQVLAQGIPQLIAQGMRPDDIVNPADGQRYSFIVLSLQHWSWSPNPAWLPYNLAWLKANYRIDTSRVYVTGLSAGGQGSFFTATHSDAVSSLVTAVAPMSPAGQWPYDSTMIRKYKIPTWFFSGNSDYYPGGYTYNAELYNSMANRQVPGSSRLNLYQGGHCCWNTYYHTAWRDPATGLSLWEWFLKHKKQTLVLPVKLTSFTAALQGTRALITWTTEEEANFSHFELERSKDGRNWRVVVRQPGLGAGYRYTAQDPALGPGKSFYRLRMVDLDDHEEYSQVKTINQAPAELIQVYDVSGRLIIQVLGDQDEARRHLHKPGVYLFKTESSSERILIQ